MVALALPGLWRVLLVPGVVELAILLRQAQAVAVAHVEVGAGDHPADLRAWHRLARLEVHHHRAGAVLLGYLRQPAEAEVAAVAIDLADARHQVVQVGLGALVGAVVPRAVAPPAVLPAAPLVTDHPGRNDVKCAR